MGWDFHIQKVVWKNENSEKSQIFSCFNLKIMMR